MRQQSQIYVCCWFKWNFFLMLMWREWQRFLIKSAGVIRTLRSCNVTAVVIWRSWVGRLELEVGKEYYRNIIVFNYCIKIRFHLCMVHSVAHIKRFWSIRKSDYSCIVPFHFIWWWSWWLLSHTLFVEWFVFCWSCLFIPFLLATKV